MESPCELERQRGTVDPWDRKASPTLDLSLRPVSATLAGSVVSSIRVSLEYRKSSAADVILLENARSPMTWTRESTSSINCWNWVGQHVTGSRVSMSLPRIASQCFAGEQRRRHIGGHIALGSAIVISSLRERSDASYYLAAVGSRQRRRLCSVSRVCIPTSTIQSSARSRTPREGVRLLTPPHGW